ncbi:EAL domain-containing protein [Komagataeibacter rhaeticus]|uniref:EAL domain-containing protein n=1 Tax=Komagataeibacter rhaeticus TaxID=215221 RepID=UPI0039EB5648
MPDITRIASSLLEKLPLAVMMADVSGQVIYANACASRLTGYDPADREEKWLGRLFPEPMRPTGTPAAWDAHIAPPGAACGATRNGSSATLRRRDGLGLPVRLWREGVDWDGVPYELITFQDRTEEEQAREDGAISALIMQATDRGILVLDPQYRITHANRAVASLLGMTVDALRHAPFGTLLSGAESDIGTLRQFRRQLSLRTGFELDVHTRGPQGTDLWLRCAVTPHFGDDGALADIIVILHDITHDRQLRDLQRDVVEALTDQFSLREMLDFMCRRIELIAPDCMAVVMLSTGAILHAGGHGALPMPVLQAFEGLEASTAGGACGTAIATAEEVVIPDFSQETRWAALRDVAAQQGLAAEWAVPIILRNGDVAGSFSLYFRTPGQPDRWHRRIVNACVHLAMLAVEQQRSRESIIRLSYTDRLTGLPNRAWLHRRMAELAARPPVVPLSVLIIDLDRFRKIVQALGQGRADQLLLELADRLRHGIVGRDVLIRTEGDEFVVLTEESSADITLLAERIIHNLEEPLSVDGIPVSLSGSIGISTPDDGQDMEERLRQAYTALAQAKKAGRCCYRFFHPSMNRQADDHVILASALREAIADNRLTLVYQPQVDLRTGALHGVEALSRWNDPVLGMVSPGRFIPVAEETGQIRELGIWSLRVACEQMADWIARGIKVPTVSVNLSAIQFQDPELVAQLGAILHQTGVPPERLIVELTETAMIENFDQTLATATAIRNLGIGLSMDDFGTGYSSLSNLAGLPISEVKIDRSFMNGFGSTGNVRQVVTAIIRIGHTLGMTVIAEGVEEAEQCNQLRAIGCDVIQGYYFGRPMDTAALDTWISERRVEPVPVA